MDTPSTPDLTRFADAPVVTTDDGVARAAVSLSLGCPYCGGELSPVLAYANYDSTFVGTECDQCLAEWDKEGTATKGPLAFVVERAVEIAAEIAASPPTTAYTGAGTGEI